MGIELIRRLRTKRNPPRLYVDIYLAGRPAKRDFIMALRALRQIRSHDNNFLYDQVMESGALLPPKGNAKQ